MLSYQNLLKCACMSSHQLLRTYKHTSLVLYSPATCIKRQHPGVALSSALRINSLHYSSAVPSASVPDKGGSESSKNETVSLLQKILDTNRGGEILQVLAKLSTLVKEGKIDFKKDVENSKEFKAVWQKLQESKFSGKWTVNCLQYVLLFESSSEQHSDLLNCLQQSLRWSIGRDSISLLIGVMEIQIKNPSLPDQKKLLKECIEAIQLRWVEVIQPYEMIGIYNNSSAFTSEFLHRIDNAVTKRCQDWTGTEICHVISALSNNKRRATYALRGLAFHLSKSEDILPPKLVASTLHACRILNFHDDVLLEYFGKCLTSGIPTITKSNILSNILFCMGQLRWREPQLLDLCTNWILENTNSCRPNDYVSLLLTAANVNYTPTEFDSLLNTLNRKVTLETVGKETIWLDVVWSLLVLERASESQIKSVLTPQFKTVLSQCAAQNSLKRLQNIEALEDLTLGGSETSKIISHLKNDVKKDSNTTQVGDKILENLAHLYPAPQYLKANIDTAFGSEVLAEFVSNEKGKALPLSFLSGSKENTVPFACVFQDYKDFCLPSSARHLTGSNELFLRWLKKKGMTVLSVPHHKFNAKDGTLQNVKYLQAEINELIKS